MATVNVNLIDGSVATLDNREVSEIYGVDTQVFLEIPTDGAQPLILESSDDLATTVALFSNFVSVNTPDGVRYLAPERFDLLDSNFDENVGLSFTVEVTASTGTNDITDLTVDGVSIIDNGTPLADATPANLASDLADAINSYSSTPEYTATVSGATVTVFLDPESGSDLIGTTPVETGAATTTITDLTEGSKVVYDLNEIGDTVEFLSTDDIDSLVSTLGNIVTISTIDGNIYLNKDRIKVITEVDASNSRIVYKSSFGNYDKIYYANESRSDIKTKIDAL